MIELSQAATIAAATIAAYMVAFYVLSLIKRDASIVDIGWGLGFVVVAATLFSITEARSIGYLLVTFVISIWGLRLTTHIYSRKAGSEEDWRYAQWREQYGRNWWWLSFFQVFVTQGLMMFLISAPLLLAATHAEDFVSHPLLWLGLIIWAIGFYFEAVGDWQLKKFIAKKKKRKKPKRGKQIMSEGLWRYTRHPNYFGEVTQWWGIFVAVLSLPGSAWAIISPLTITYLLLRVSGITMLEKKYEGNKEYERYKKKTNAFWPSKPKKR